MMMMMMMMKAAMTTMHRYPSRFAVVFLLLALAALVFLLRNIHTLQISGQIMLQLNFNTVLLLEDSSSPPRPPPGGLGDSLWSCPGQTLSAGDAQEERALLDAIAWPQHPRFPAGVHLRQTSDPAHSSFTILSGDEEEGRRGETTSQYRVGGRLRALIRMRDFEGRPKRYGGDVLLARLHEPTLGAGVAGQVVDHLDGSYSATFPLLWEGRACVEVTLVHPSEAVTVLRRLTREQPDRVFFHSTYLSAGQVSETTVCNVCLAPTPGQLPPPPPPRLCNYTDPHTGEPWYCYRPKQLGCEARATHAKGGFNQNIRANEHTLFQSGINMKVPVKASGPASVIVLHEQKVNDSHSAMPPGGASGYYYQGAWRALGGTAAVQRFNNASAIARCLSNKSVHMYGDSTARQWFEYLTESLPDLKEMDLHSLKQTGPFLAVDPAHNVLVTYRCHGPPLRFATVPTSELRYVANELDGLAGGPGTVVVLSVWSHFSTFPVEVYIRRLRSIRRSVVRLLDRAPGTLVVVRTPNLKALTLYETLTNSDWYSLQHLRVLRAMFRDLPRRVVLVDAWEMTLAHSLPHSLHPQPAIIKNMIDVLLSNICPPR